MKKLFAFIILLLLPTQLYAAGGDQALLNLEMITSPAAIFSLIVFIVAYFFVMTEEFSHLRKSKPVVLASGVIWLAVVITASKKGISQDLVNYSFRHVFLEFAELFMFLLVAMTFINTMTERNVFEALRVWLVNKGFDYRADTTFSIAEQIRKTIIDTLYWTLEYSDSTKTLLDTNYVNSSEIKKRMNLFRFNPANTSLLSERDSTITEEEYDNLLSFEQKRFYRVVKDTIPGKIEISEREEVKNNYLRKKFHLNADLLTCPLSKKDYILALEQQNSGENIFIVKSPVDESNIETQYYFFEYNPGDHGYIRSGVQSWAGEE